jgi:hypothetical protein
LTEFGAADRDSEPHNPYSVSEAAVAELEAQKKRREIERMCADLAANNARAHEEAMDRPGHSQVKFTEGPLCDRAPASTSSTARAPRRQSPHPQRPADPAPLLLSERDASAG